MSSQLEEAAARFRAQLERREVGAVHTMRRALADTEELIGRRLEAALDRIYAAKVGGRAPGVTALYEAGRLVQLEREVAEAMRQYGGRAKGVVAKLMADDGDAALAASERFVKAAARDLGLPHADSLSIPRAHLEHVVAARANLAEGSPLAELFDDFGRTAAQRVGAGITQGLALGQSPELVGRRIRADVVETYANRSQVIARTEAHRVVRGTTLEAFRASDAVVGWQWLSSGDRRTCAACLAMHGTIHDLEEPLAGHPSCRCTMVPVLAGDLGAPRPLIPSGEEVFDAMSDADRLYVLGPAKYAAYQAGELRLGDLAQRLENSRWGPMHREASLVQARRNAAAREAGGRPGPGRPPARAQSADPTPPAPPAGPPPPPPAPPAPVPAPLLEPDGILDLGPIEPGTMLGDARRRPAVRQHVSEALDVLRRVLRVPDYTAAPYLERRVPVVIDPNLHLEGTAGAVSFRPVSGDGLRPERIALSHIDKLDQRRVSTFLHEYGHLMDFGPMAETPAELPGFGGKLRGPSTHDPDLEEWREAVRASRAFARIATDPDMSAGRRTYLLSMPELWARAFAQWTLKRSGIRGDLQREIASRPEQWQDEDFEAVAAAMDRYFTRKGWTP